MKAAIDEVIFDVLQRRAAKQDDDFHAHERHVHTNQEFQNFCNRHLIPLLVEARQALLVHQMPAEIEINPTIGFNTIDGPVLVIGTHEFKGTNLLNSTNRVFISFELDIDDLSLHVQVGGNNVILSNFPPQLLAISENSLPEIQHIIKEVVREAATIFFKV